MIARNENKNIFGFYKHFFFTINIARVDVIATFHNLPILQKNAWFLGKYNTIYYKYVWIQSYSGADMTITHDFYIFFFALLYRPRKSLLERHFIYRLFALHRVLEKKEIKQWKR